MASETLSGHANLFNDISTFPLIALSLFPLKNVEGGIFTRITMTSMTGSWYLPLNHFEAILVGLIVLEIFVMRYLLILPLDITKLIESGTLLATDISRKRRAALPTTNCTDIIEQKRLAETVFVILRRIDEHDCFLRTLCELEFSKSNDGAIHSSKISRLLSNLKRLGLKRRHHESLTVPNNVTITERSVLSQFEEAVLLGSGDNFIASSSATCNSNNNASEDSCAIQYSLCTQDKNELLEYVQSFNSLLL